MANGENDQPEPLSTAPGNGLLKFDLKSVVSSPLFWMAAGAAVTVFLQHSAKKKYSGGSRQIKNVTPGYGEE